MARTAGGQYNELISLPLSDLQEGDLVFFNNRENINHVGIYLGEGFFVHASTTSGVTINNLQEPYYNSRFISGGRPGLNQNNESAGVVNYSK